MSYLPHLFSQSFIYTSIRLMDIYFILWVMIFLDYFILLHRLFYFSHLELFQLGSGVLSRCHQFFLSTFKLYKMFQVHQVFALPQLWNQPLLQGTLVPVIGETKIWAVSVLSATQTSLLLGSQGTEPGNPCVNINSCIYIHIYISIFISLYTYVYVCIYILVS